MFMDHRIFERQGERPLFLDKTPGLIVLIMHIQYNV
ncbi:hypothetical protein MITS9509_02365 [Synechococcus sp. MIT S9509]|nr:hypothetical protein MITS9504_02187 [Synechococcus sp. MIT S9504]KZR91429.1 hypothetical protein MITS9509_02365 [Synechococcus sp. MIT S9509]